MTAIATSHFGGYKWFDWAELPDSSYYDRLYDAIEWKALRKIASSARGGMKCVLEDQRARGGRHIIRIVKFADGVRWIARAAMLNISTPESISSDDSSWMDVGEDALIDFDANENMSMSMSMSMSEVIDSQAEMLEENTSQHDTTTDEMVHHEEPSASDVALHFTHDPMQLEVDTLQLVKERTTIPVPAIYRYSASDYDRVGAAFMLMDCLPGNVGTDLVGSSGVPQQYMDKYLNQLAKIHTEMASITFSKIGCVNRQPDGSYHIGPIYGLGGPFDTATEFFKAWAAQSKFEKIHTQGIITSCGGPGPAADEALQAMQEFPAQLAKLLEQGPLNPEFDKGPFPLRHVDFGHNNIIVDDEWNILGVIDWEYAIAAPWEMVSENMTVRHMSRTIWPMYYTDTGAPRDDARVNLGHQAYLLACVKKWENELGLTDTLSRVMSSEKMVDLAYAFKSYEEYRKPGFYLRMLRAHFGDRMEDF